MAARRKKGAIRKAIQLPILIERDEDSYYVVECPLFSGCYTQGKTLDQAMANIQEVIGLCLEEKANQDRLRDYHPRELAFHTLTYV
jgi:predicted RNase H-like HicB family nuclease